MNYEFRITHSALKKGGLLMTYDDIVTALAGAGITVKYPGAKQGVCTAPYAVVQDFGTYPYAQSAHLGYTLIQIHCYAPVGNYPALPLLISQVKTALAPLAADLRPTGSEGIHDINDVFKAHTGYVEYILQKRLF